MILKYLEVKINLQFSNATDCIVFTERLSQVDRCGLYTGVGEMMWFKFSETGRESFLELNPDYTVALF